LQLGLPDSCIFSHDPREYIGMWEYNGQRRPSFAEQPGPEQESVWDYPRPPALRNSNQLVEVKNGSVVIASSERSARVLETASPPTVYLPPEDVNMDLLQPIPGESFCEWKGAAAYWGLKTNPNQAAIGWSYPDPSAPFAILRDWLCFYPGRVACFIAGERVRPQEGGFYGGWVTDCIVGPWKGAPGRSHW